jgi:hypothetical protein
MSQAASGRDVNWGEAMMQGTVSFSIAYGTSVGLQKFGLVSDPDPRDVGAGKTCTGGNCRTGAGGRGSGCSCFAAGTLVATAVGLIPIEQIEVGDLVVSRDAETQQTDYRRVARTFVSDDRELLQLSFSSQDGVTTETVTTTPNHPFYVDGKGWVEAQYLEIDTSVSTQTGLARLSAALSMNERGRVYNFEVEEFNTYFVGEGRHYVHNQCACPGTGQPGGSSSGGDGDGTNLPPAPANDNGPGPRVALVDGDGPVVVKVFPGATDEQIGEFKSHVEGLNRALEEGALSPTGRVSTKGDLAHAAQAEAVKERAAAAARGTPYPAGKVVGHVPDTTWTNNPKPHSWQPLDPKVNSSLAGQWNRYCNGYRPTIFIVEF